jgi:hypothetical protein
MLNRKMGPGQKYTQKQMFREEIESPFRKTRLFLVPALAASAALGAFIRFFILLSVFYYHNAHEFLSLCFSQYLVALPSSLSLFRCNAVGLVLLLRRRGSQDMTLERRYVGETVCARVTGREAARKRMCVCVKAEGRREAERQCKFNTKMLDC